MKNCLYLLLLLPAVLFGQNADLPKGIWDKQLSTKFNVREIGYNEIPRELVFRGVLVQALEFDDANGHNLLIMAETGLFGVSVKDEKGAYKRERNRAELNAYLYVRSDDKSSYRSMWKIADFQECAGTDLYAGYTKGSMSVTDADADGIAETSFQYTLACRSSKELPSDRKLYCIESNEKTSFLGITQLEGMPLDEPMIDAKTEMSAAVKELMQKKWAEFAAEQFPQFNAAGK